MKLKSLLFVIFFNLISNAFAANLHLHPNINAADKESAPKATMYPGYCQIEVINNSSNYVRVSGIFDDSTYLDPFTVFAFEAPHYISLYYYGYCHSGMNISILSAYGALVYSGWTDVHSTIRIVDYFDKGHKSIKAEIATK